MIYFNITKKWNNTSLNRKFIIIIILTNTLLFSAISILGMHIVTTAYNKTLYNSLSTRVSSSMQNFRHNLDNLNTLSEMILADPQIQKQLDYLNVPEDILEKRNVYNKVYNTVVSYSDTFQRYGVSYISIYAKDFAVHTYQSLAQAVPGGIIKNLLDTAIEQDGRLVLNTGHTAKHNLFLTRAIKKIAGLDLSILGTMNIAVDIENLVEKALYSEDVYDTTLYLLFDKENPVYIPDNFTGENVESVRKQLQRTYGVVTNNNNYYFAAQGSIPGYDWDYICMIPYTSVFHSVRTAIILYFCIFVFSIFLSAICSNLLIGSITKHIQKLVTKMNHFKGTKENLKDFDDYDYNIRNDEIGIMHQQFLSMASEIQMLIQTDYENRILTKDAQLKALASQIHPHFLYNTLESVNWRAKAIGADDISAMVEALGTLFRASMDSDTIFHSVRQELELTTGYLVIQKLRFEERITYEIHVLPDVIHTQIPKLTIQPLVENSVRYGLEQNIEKCRIIISVYALANRLYIQIRNSGSHFPDNLLERLSSKELQSNGFGIGLLNIDHRLKLTFSQEYGLMLYNENDMAVAQITIPFNQDDSE